MKTYYLCTEGCCKLEETPGEVLKVTRKSMISETVHTLEIPGVSAEQIIAWHSDELLVQNCFPNLSIPLREFLISGITPEEWNETFSLDEEE